MSNISMKLKKLTKIKNEIARIIDENQDIKRYCTYLTNTPLMSMGMDSSGKMQKQPNIDKSIIDKNIIPYRFMEEVLESSEVIIFIYFDEAELSSQSLGSYTFAIDIFVPKPYDVLKEMGQERNVEIATTIADLLDSKKLSGDLTLGEVDIRYARQTRLSNKSNYTVFALNLEIKGSNFRVGR